MCICATASDTSKLTPTLKAAGRLDHIEQLSEPTARERVGLLMSVLQGVDVDAAAVEVCVGGGGGVWDIHIHTHTYIHTHTHTSIHTHPYTHTQEVAVATDGCTIADLQALAQRAQHAAASRLLTTPTASLNPPPQPIGQHSGQHSGQHMALTLTAADWAVARDGFVPSSFWGVRQGGGGGGGGTWVGGCGGYGGCAQGAAGITGAPHTVCVMCGGGDCVYVCVLGVVTVCMCPTYLVHVLLHFVFLCCSFFLFTFLSSTPPRRYAHLTNNAPIRLRTGVLLYGPPGCGKTHIVNAAVAAVGMRVVSIKGPEVLNKYIGASEAAVRDLFR